MNGMDFSTVIEDILSNKSSDWGTRNKIKSKEEIEKLSKKTFLGVHTSDFGLKSEIFTEFPLDGVLMGFEISGGFVVFSKDQFCITNGGFIESPYSVFPIEIFPELVIERDGITSDSVFLDGERVGNFNRQSILTWNQITDHINSFIIPFCKKKLEEQESSEMEEKLKELRVSQTNILSELDKDGNGVVDLVEGDDFNLLLKKHQQSIVELDRNYVQQFVKVSSYLKTKKVNIQTIFDSIIDTPNKDVLNRHVDILKGEIHTYNLVLFNSLNMIVSLLDDDMITFYEIYEVFDDLNMFDSKHEKDLSLKLTNISGDINDLMSEVKTVGETICKSIETLSNVTQDTGEKLSKHLSKIDSTLKVGNLINTINLFQNNKTNKLLSK